MLRRNNMKAVEGISQREPVKALANNGKNSPSSKPISGAINDAGGCRSNAVKKE
jgi:hypothetical protein